MMHRAATLDSIARDILADNVTPDLRGSATQLVMGEGSPEADILLIGEAPGRREDEAGRPFVGASGRFLDEMLVAAGLSRDDVYITNIVKYRPPNNRDPSPEEKAAFWPYLVRQIEVISPKIIITLGRHSGAAFVSGLVISRDYGQPRQVQLGDKQYLLVPLYHPAAALYNGSMRQVLVEDFVRAVELKRCN